MVDLLFSGRIVELTAWHKSAIVEQHVIERWKISSRGVKVGAMPQNVPAFEVGNLSEFRSGRLGTEAAVIVEGPAHRQLAEL